MAITVQHGGDALVGSRMVVAAMRCEATLSRPVVNDGIVTYALSG